MAVCHETNRCLVLLLPINPASPSPAESTCSGMCSGGSPTPKRHSKKMLPQHDDINKIEMQSHKPLWNKDANTSLAKKMDLSVTPDLLMILNIHLEHISLAHVLCRSCRFAGRAQQDTHPDEHTCWMARLHDDVMTFQSWSENRSKSERNSSLAWSTETLGNVL